MKSISAELADCLRLLNARYCELTDRDAVSFDDQHLAELESRVGVAMAAGDDPAARGAIREWRAAWLAEFARADSR